jgi:histidine ammonia-lyase
MYAAQAIEFRRPYRCSALLEKNHRLIRAHIAPLEDDRLLKDDIDTMITLVQSQKFTVK